MAKPCIHCQNLLADNAQFCERCGTRQPATPPQKKNGGLIAICIEANAEHCQFSFQDFRKL